MIIIPDRVCGDCTIVKAEDGRLRITLCVECSIWATSIPEIVVRGGGKPDRPLDAEMLRNATASLFCDDNGL